MKNITVFENMLALATSAADADLAKIYSWSHNIYETGVIPTLTQRAKAANLSSYVIYRDAIEASILGDTKNLVFNKNFATDDNRLCITANLVMQNLASFLVRDGFPVYRFNHDFQPGMSTAEMSELPLVDLCIDFESEGNDIYLTIEEVNEARSSLYKEWLASPSKQ